MGHRLKFFTYIHTHIQTYGHRDKATHRARWPLLKSQQVSAWEIGLIRSAVESPFFVFEKRKTAKYNYVSEH